MQGWVKLHRSVTDSFVFQNPDRLKFWIWCLCKSTHKPRKQSVGLVQIELKKGQFIFGRKKASIELGMEESKIYRLLKTFEKREKIEVKSNNKFSIVTVVNWEFYQGDEQQSEQQSNNKLTTNEQQSNTNKNVKNVKKEEIPPKWSEESVEYRIGLYLFSYMKKNNPNANKPNLQIWAEDADKILRIDGYNVEVVKAMIKFSQNSEFWKTNILSIGKLRKQMNQLVLKANQKPDTKPQKEIIGAIGSKNPIRRPNRLDS